MRRCCLIILILTAIAHAEVHDRVQASNDNGVLTLSNDSISATWTIRNGSLRWRSITNRLTQETLNLEGQDVFELTPREGEVIRSSDPENSNTVRPLLENAPASADSSKAADRIPGRQIRLIFHDRASNLQIEWRAILREGANYFRQEVTIQAVQLPAPLTAVTLIDVNLPSAQVNGHVKGSPVTASTWFLALEHPLSECRAHRVTSSDRATCSIFRELPLLANESVTYSSVIGATHRGQLRRDFLNYLELERAHPYRTFLHYNSWYDLGFFDRYSEQQAVTEIETFGEQLTRRRGVKLDSFLFDDGWDDPSTLWHFNPGFPNGFTKVSEAAAKFSAAPGIWFSPWGGYDGPKTQRLASAKSQGFETNEGGFALSGPKYYKYFRDACFDMIEKYGINQFKFDGTGNANEVIKGSQFDSDFDAAIHLIGELRVKKPDIYINLTTGTYPSPFWLLYADSIWRGGEDHSFAGVGPNRQRWITYRDSQIYQRVVEDGPLFPMNSLMLHGLIYARYAERLGSDPTHDFADEVHSYFGTGTQLQEMYITPTLLSPQDWDTLAEAAKWSRENAQTLNDSHWIGGNPSLLEVYGWASLSQNEAKGIITLRNPSDHQQDFTASLASLLELPDAAPSQFNARSPWKFAASPSEQKLASTDSHTFHLKPFEVLTLELVP
ncbi:MAG TPA: enterotoxin [Candidatus Solibacter sp.]|nr:enterotoxin [Candidatus Solibacter sp.]